jgi:large subunit ribosomal protein L35
MPKMKTHRSAAKRFRRTANGKIVRKQAYRSHLLEKKSARRKRRLGASTQVSDNDARRIRRVLGG